MRFFLDGGKKVWVDDDDSCVQHHVRRDPPLFHLMRGSSSTAFLARCPRTLSPEQRARLKNHDASSLRQAAPGSPNASSPIADTGATPSKPLKPILAAKGRN